jgi:hypothetical protein
MIDQHLEGMAEMAGSDDAAESMGLWPPLLADNECRHGRFPGDLTPVCGCFGAEGVA